MNENQRRYLAKDFRFIVGAIGICSLLGFLETFVPLLDLFNHFRLQAVVGAIFCALCSAYLKDKPATLIACTILALNICAISYKLVLTAGVPALNNNAANFSIISSNVLTSNDDYQAVIDMVATQDPDLVVFSEIDHTWADKLDVLEKDYPHKLLFPRPDNFGLAAFSKKPFRGEVTYAGEAGLPVMAIRYDGLTVIGAHPIPPASMRNMQENRNYLAEVARIGNEEKTPVVIAGDLNATLWSATLVPLIETGFKRINPLGIAYTWPAGNWAYILQIDHFFGKNITAADFHVLDDVGSDHYPIRADIVY